MNEQALQNIYRDVVKNQDYRGSKEDFIALLSSDQAAFDDRFEWVNGEGYKGTKEQFAELVGVTMPVKKKEEEEGKKKKTRRRMSREHRMERQS